MDNFKAELKNTNWNMNSHGNSSNSNISFTNFIKTFFDIYDKHFPEIKQKVKIKDFKSYYSSLIKKYVSIPKKTWQIMKEITGKKKM